MIALVSRFCCIVFLSVLISTSGRACPAKGFVLNAGSAFMAAANAGSPSAFSNAAARYADLRGIALFALGQHRKNLSKSNEAQYISLARGFMGKFMASNASRLRGTGLKVVSCRGNKVNATMASGKALVFRVIKTRNGFRVQDVSVSSIWLTGQLRSKFVGIVNRNGGNLEALMVYLRG